MKKSEREQIEQRLREERDRVLAILRQLEEEKAPPGELAGEISRYPVHMADEASNTDERERDFLMAQLGSERLQRIDAALELLIRDPKAFEKCESCGRAIEVERLDVIPWTRLCAECARQAEVGGGRGGGGGGTAGTAE